VISNTLADINLKDNTSRILFTALANGNKLKQLDISCNDITDEACNEIATSLKTISSVLQLKMINVNISAEAAQSIVKALNCNDTLELLQMPQYSETEKKVITSLQQEVMQNRQKRDCQTNLEILFG